MSDNQPGRLITMLMLVWLLLISHGVGSVRCSTVPDNSTDMLSLQDFQRAITDDPGQALSSWNTSITHCQWEGVTCSRRHPGRVTVLKLAGHNLQGQVTPSLGNLTFLRELNLSSNNFFGQLPNLNRLHKLQLLFLGKNKLDGFTPDALTNCSNLLRLDLSTNSLKGSLPANIGLLSSLLSLNLIENNFTGLIPSSLQNMTHLRLIILSQNQLQGSIPEELGQLQNLKGLLLAGNGLSGRIPTSLLNHSTLQALDLNSNFLKMVLPSNIGNTLPSLSQISLRDNMFEGQIPASLGNASLLSVIGLMGNNLTGQVPSSLGMLSQLSYLRLNENKLEANDSKSWEFLDRLSNCRLLQLLELSDNQLQGPIPNSIGNFSSNLRYLGLDANNLSMTVPESIGNLTGLLELTLSQNNLTGPIGPWIGNLKNLGALSLSDNSFTGPIPSSIGTFTVLTRLFLYGNNFEGPIPPSLGNLPSLSVLNLSHNNLNGNIPKELFSPLSTMTKCDLSYNYLEGPVPSEIRNLNQITFLHLSSNKLTGEIPPSLGECLQLQTLLMDNTILEGNIPRSLISLKSLSVLNLSHNNLSGSIPIELSQLSSLTQLDLSYNNLQGEIPRDGVFGNASTVSLGSNWRLCGGMLDLHMPSCTTASGRKKVRYYLIRVLIPVFGFMSLLLLIYTLISGKKKSQRTHLLLLSFGKKFPVISYNDLRRATRNFPESSIIGRGSYGSVYIGKLTQAKIPVAIKVFDLDMKCGDKSFVTECNVLRSIRHRNLLPILTACSTIDNNGDDFKALISEYMPNGNLDTWLHKKSPDDRSKCLSFVQRVNILVGIADALAYLHHDCERLIVHCDLKPTNILLDDDMNAYLGDFGIASLLGNSSPNISTELKGTIGYIAPEYAQSGHTSSLGDVYSFGIVLLEMLIVKRPIDPMFENDLNMVIFVERSYPDQILNVIDVHLHEEFKNNIQADVKTEDKIYGCLLSLIQVALSCTRVTPKDRMNMREVATSLHAIRTLYIGATREVQVTTTG